jgi:2-polyprenyl-6-methoxyphenol hydroxylase-like FAD-dependent oxidoreductase
MPSATKSSARSDNPDVVVIGAGPVGLCLANLLVRAGVATLLLEAEAAIETDLRASTFHPPTLDMLDALGVTADLLAQGLVCPTWQIRMHPGGERAVFDMSVLAGETAHPYRLQCEQWKLSNALRTRFESEPNGILRFGAKLLGLTQTADRVQLEIETAEGCETVSAPYVVGCDGARSTVRGALDLDFAGMTYPETTILATTRFPFEDHLEGISNVTYCWKEGGNFALLKVPGRWRVSIYPREDLPLEAQMTETAIDASLQDIVARNRPYEVLEVRPYRVHRRIVSAYRKGRVALAGDAAHVNSPTGGMGLNGGIHDAFSLAERLIDIVKHGAGEEQLDLYDRRRRPVAENDILAQADRNRARMREKDQDRRLASLAELQAITSDRGRLKDYLLRSSMIEGLRRAAAVS